MNGIETVKVMGSNVHSIIQTHFVDKSTDPFENVVFLVEEDLKIHYFGEDPETDPDDVFCNFTVWVNIPKDESSYTQKRIVFNISKDADKVIVSIENQNSGQDIIDIAKEFLNFINNYFPIETLRREEKDSMIPWGIHYQLLFDMNDAFQYFIDTTDGASQVDLALEELF